MKWKISFLSVLFAFSCFSHVAEASDRTQRKQERAVISAMGTDKDSRAVAEDAIKARPITPEDLEADVAFAKAVIAQHEQVIELAKTQLKDGKDARLRSLADDILIAQNREIKLLNEWLAEHDGIVKAKEDL